jgi:hypothetical protein
MHLILSKPLLKVVSHCLEELSAFPPLAHIAAAYRVSIAQRNELAER